MQKDQLKNHIRTKAEEIGFLHVGFSKADFLASWQNGLHGKSF
jgi:epoxyqueuosine reductase